MLPQGKENMEDAFLIQRRDALKRIGKAFIAGLAGGAGILASCSGNPLKPKDAGSHPYSSYSSYSSYNDYASYSSYNSYSSYGGYNSYSSYSRYSSYSSYSSYGYYNYYNYTTYYNYYVASW